MVPFFMPLTPRFPPLTGKSPNNYFQWVIRGGFLEYHRTSLDIILGGTFLGHQWDMSGMRKFNMTVTIVSFFSNVQANLGGVLVRGK